MRFARATRRTKSDVARDAMREYLDRHAADEEYQRQVAAIAAATSESDFAELEAIGHDALADEPDYDWGDQPR